MGDKKNRKRLRTIGCYTLMSAASLIVLSALLSILFFIFSNGLSGVSSEFLTTADSYEKGIVTVEALNPGDLQYKIAGSSVEVTQTSANVEHESDLPLTVSTEYEINRINDNPISYMEKDEIDELLTSGTDLTLAITVHEKGILSMIVSTLILIGLSLLISLPLGIGSAIYLIEYPISDRLDRAIHFAINSLTAIPSIVFGLFSSFLLSSLLCLSFISLASIIRLPVPFIVFVSSFLSPSFTSILRLPDPFTSFTNPFIYSVTSVFTHLCPPSPLHFLY